MNTDNEMLLARAFIYVGASELERDYLWEEMQEWHRTVAKLLDLPPEAWSDEPEKTGENK